MDSVGRVAWKTEKGFPLSLSLSRANIYKTKDTQNHAERINYLFVSLSVCIFWTCIFYSFVADGKFSNSLFCFRFSFREIMQQIKKGSNFFRRIKIVEAILQSWNSFYIE